MSYNLTKASVFEVSQLERREVTVTEFKNAVVIGETGECDEFSGWFYQNEFYYLEGTKYVKLVTANKE